MPSSVGRVRQPARRRARRDHRTVVRDGVSVVGRDGAGADVEGGGAHAEPQLEVEVVVRLAAQREAVGLGLAGEEVLRERRPVVREVGFGAHEAEGPVEAQAAQLLRRAQAGERRTHHDDTTE